MITLSNLKVQIEIPALDRIANALEGMHRQMNGQWLTLQQIEEQLLDISQELEELNESRQKPKDKRRPQQEFYY
jgi:hypothetical protein